MKAFVFKPTNEFFGKFVIRSEQALPEELKKFLVSHPTVPKFAYLEVESKAWTILSLDPLQLVSGIVRQEQSKPRNKEQNERGETNQQRGRDAQGHTVAFDCLDCATGIRIRQLQGNSVYRCPSCKTEYKVIQASAEPLVFLVVPTSRHQFRASAEPSKTKRQVPPEVCNALRLFGLGDEASFGDVRQGYREHVKQYHPDLVAHLGPELRVVAEKKTKEFNAAYQILERFYAV